MLEDLVSGYMKTLNERGTIQIEYGFVPHHNWSGLFCIVTDIFKKTIGASVSVSPSFCKKYAVE